MGDLKPYQSEEQIKRNKALTEKSKLAHQAYQQEYQPIIDEIQSTGKVPSWSSWTALKTLPGRAFETVGMAMNQDPRYYEASQEKNPRLRTMDMEVDQAKKQALENYRLQQKSGGKSGVTSPWPVMTDYYPQY